MAAVRRRNRAVQSQIASISRREIGAPIGSIGSRLTVIRVDTVQDGAWCMPWSRWILRGDVDGRWAET